MTTTTTGIGIMDDYMASREGRRTLAASGDGLENHPAIRDLQRRISELRAASGGGSSSHDRRRREEREPDHNYSYDALFDQIGRGF